MAPVAPGGLERVIFQNLRFHCSGKPILSQNLLISLAARSFFGPEKQCGNCFNIKQIYIDNNAQGARCEPGPVVLDVFIGGQISRGVIAGGLPRGYHRGVASDIENEAQGAYCEPEPVVLDVFIGGQISRGGYRRGQTCTHCALILGADKDR